jgi:hypothetical protein
MIYLIGRPARTLYVQCSPTLASKYGSQERRAERLTPRGAVLPTSRANASTQATPATIRARTP